MSGPAAAAQPAPDRETRRFERALEPRSARKLLQAALAPGLEVHEVLSAEVVKERPGRRTIRYRVRLCRDGGVAGESVVYGKLYRGSKGGRTHARLRALWTHRPAVLALPEPLGYSPRYRLLVLGEVPGPTLGELWRRGSPERRPLREDESPARALERLGAALAAFHALAAGGAGDWPELPVHGAEAERLLLRGLAAALDACGLPAALREEWRALEDVVGARLVSGEGSRGDGAGDRSLLHRDLHPEQVVLLPDRVGLLDLDEVARGERELDLGNLSAHLTLLHLQLQGRPGQDPGGERRLLEGYRTVSPAAADRLEVYAAAALLRLALLDRLAAPEISRVGRLELARGLIAAARRRLQLAPDGPRASRRFSARRRSVA